MNPKEFQFCWDKLLPQIKQKFSKISDEDLKQINGKRDVLLSKIKQKYGIKKQKAEQQLKHFESTFTKSASNQ